MNRFINALLVFILIPTMLVTIIVGFDLPLTFLKTTGAELPYRAEIFLSIGVLILLINVRRSIKRWMGIRLVTQVKKFKWNAPVSTTRKKRVTMYLILEIVVFAFVGIALYEVTSQAWMPAIAFVYVALDNIIFTIVGFWTNAFRVGLSSKALIVADREVTVLYFSGLRKVSQQQQSIYFDYIKGLQLHFPTDCIPEEKRAEFFALLESQMDPNRVFFSKVMA